MTRVLFIPIIADVPMDAVPLPGVDGGSVTNPIYVRDGTHAAVGIGEPSSPTTAALLIEELVVGPGGNVSQGDVVIWSGAGCVNVTDGTENLTSIAGVAIESGAPGSTIKVCRRGRVQANFSQGPCAAGTLLGTVGGDFGVSGPTSPGAGAIIGRATQARGADDRDVIIDVVLA